jgi:hypothetical protein
VLTKLHSRTALAAIAGALVLTGVSDPEPSAVELPPNAHVTESQVDVAPDAPTGTVERVTQPASVSVQTPSRPSQVSALPTAGESDDSGDGVDATRLEGGTTPGPPIQGSGEPEYPPPSGGSLPEAGEPSTVLTEGNFQTYGGASFSAYTGMWGLIRTQTLVADSSMRVTPSTFPNGTVFNWDLTPAPDWGGVSGYLHVAYGNYDDSPGTITPRRVRDITDLTVDIGWAFRGDEASGLLAECWLSPEAARSGGFPKTHEIGIFPKTTPAAQEWLATLPAVGTGSLIDSNGFTWNVRESGTYRVAYPPDYADYQGPLPFRDFFAFLTESGEITGNEWFNGLAFGVEPHSGAGSLTITKFAPTYSGA